MKIICNFCDHQYPAQKPYMANYSRTTASISPAGSKKMEVKGTQTCPSCGNVLSYVEANRTWIEMLLEDLDDMLLVIRSLTDVSLHKKSGHSSNSQPIYQLEQIEIDGLVRYAGIVFKQNKNSSKSGSTTAIYNINGNVSGNITAGNGNKVGGTISVGDHNIHFSTVGNGIQFYKES